MKIKVNDELKKAITLSEKLIIDEICECCEEDSINNYVSSMLSLAGAKFSSDVKVYKATAEIVKNGDVWNAYGTIDADGNAVGVNTEDFDVWIEIEAFVKFDGFYIIGAYLSDLWSRKSDNSNDAEIRSNMYIDKYTKSDWNNNN